MVVGPGNPQVPTDGSATMNNGQPAGSSNGEDVWDEQRIEEALKTLKEMHIQVNSMARRSLQLSVWLTLHLVAKSSNYHSEADCASDHQATLTYAPYVSIYGSAVKYIG